MCLFKLISWPVSITTIEFFRISSNCQHWSIYLPLTDLVTVISWGTIRCCKFWDEKHKAEYIVYKWLQVREKGNNCHVEITKASVKKHRSREIKGNNLSKYFKRSITMWRDLFKVLFLGNRMSSGTIKWNKKSGQGNTLRGRKMMILLSISWNLRSLWAIQVEIFSRRREDESKLSDIYLR